MSDQTIAVYSAGAVENTLPRTIYETSGDDISADPVYVSLGSWTAPGVWVTPDSVTRGTITVADYRARTGQQPETTDGTPLADDMLLHWVAMTLEIGGALKPLAGYYWLWTKITAAPETVPRRTSGRITIT